MSGSSHYFSFLSNLLEKKSMMLFSDLLSVFVQHLCKLELKFALYFQENLLRYKWIRELYVLPITSSFTEEEKEHYIDLTCDRSLKRKFNSVNLTSFWISLNDEYPALTKKHCDYLSSSLRLIYTKLDFLQWPSLNSNIHHE